MDGTLIEILKKLTEISEKLSEPKGFWIILLQSWIPLTIAIVIVWISILTYKRNKEEFKIILERNQAEFREAHRPYIYCQDVPKDKDKVPVKHQPNGFYIMLLNSPAEIKRLKFHLYAKKESGSTIQIVNTEDTENIKTKSVFPTGENLPISFTAKEEAWKNYLENEKEADDILVREIEIDYLKLGEKGKKYYNYCITSEYSFKEEFWFIKSQS